MYMINWIISFLVQQGFTVLEGKYTIQFQIEYMYCLLKEDNC